MGTRCRRSLAVLVATGLLLAIGPGVARSWSVPCSGDGANKFLGNGRSSTAMIGAYTEIKYVNKSLCQQSPTVQKYKSWSLSWVSLEGPVDPDPLDGINIYQGGY